MHMTGYRCICCGKSQDVDFAGMTCPDCGGNLDVWYDFDRLRRQVAQGESIFDDSRRDIFRYAKLFPIRDVLLASPLHVGGTPLYRAQRLGAAHQLDHLYIKDDGLNPTASFKDRAGAVALVRARETKASVIAGASTGNAGSSMAGLCASVGQSCVIFVPESAPRAKLLQLRAYGARVIAVRGTYDNAYDLCTEVCRRYGWFNRNTGTNPFTREGKKSCSFEIYEQLGNAAPDRVVVSSGDGNIISGIWKGMLDLFRIGLIKTLPKIDCIQAEGSSAIVNTVRTIRESGTSANSIDWKNVVIKPVNAHTVADSISVDVPRDGLAAVRAVIESKGEGITVSDKEIIDAAAELAVTSGIFTEPASAAAWAGVRNLRRDGLIDPGERVVCLLTGNGLKDAGAIETALSDLVVIDPDPAQVESRIRDLL